MKRALLMILPLVFAASALVASDVSGNWKLNSQVAGHDFALRMSLQQQGDAVTGSVSGPKREYPIKKGSVSNANQIEIQLGGKGPLAGSTIKGTLTGDRLQLTIQTKRGQSEATAVRSQ